MKKILINTFLWYLRTAARIQLFKIKPKIIALTGSVGKTSLRNAVYAVLKETFRCKKSIKANSETGVPLDLLGLYPKDYSVLDWLKLSFLIPWKLLTNWQKYDYYIVELGVDDPYPPKNMAYLLRFIHPDISIFLNVASVHTEQFGKLLVNANKINNQQGFLLNAIAREKGRIITSLSNTKTAIVNVDDKLVVEQANKSQARKFYFGKNLKAEKENELKIKKWKVDLKGSYFIFKYNNTSFKLQLPYLLPEYYGYTFAAAILTAICLKINLKLIIRQLVTNFKLPAGRMSVFKGIKNTILIDSSYNASKASTVGALYLLEKIDISSKIKKRKKIFVFGDMRELGNQAKIEHEQVAKKILTTIDMLVLTGP